MKKEDVTFIFKKGKEEKDLGNYRLVSLHSVPGKVMEQVLLKAISKHMKNTEGIRSSQYRFTNGNSCLADLIAFYDDCHCRQGDASKCCIP